jgi:hypothetical protein
MRRAVQALIISGVLLAAAACGTATGPTPGGPATLGTASAPGAATQAAEASTRSLCEALGQVYSKNLAPFAEALTEMVDGRKGAGGGSQDHQRQAQQSLKAFATAIRTATQDSTDPQLRTDGKKAADRLQAKAADAGFFSEIKTAEDVNTVLGPTLKEWLSPVAHHCS